MKPLMLGARLLAIAIAVAAVVDPAITTGRRGRPVISLLASEGEPDHKLIMATGNALARDYQVILAPFPNAVATVIVGNGLPLHASEQTSPVFALAPRRDGPTVTLNAVTAPSTSSIESRVQIVTTARVTGARGRSVTIELSIGGLVVDRVSRAVVSDDDRMPIALSFVPTTIGAAALRLSARVGGGSDSAVADVAVDIRDKRWAVLFFDRRPSWMSTFVRRALENDRRFVVASRVVTSGNVSTIAGRPPSSLEDATLLDLYDAIIVGAPEAMTAQDVAGLDVFLRRRGGGVVLLYDEAVADGGASTRLTGVARWAAATSPAAVPVEPTTGDGAGLRATEFAWPVTMPAGGEAVARTASATGPATSRPVVWRSWHGAGQLIVSGALDAWRYRDRATSGFDGFWRSLLADAADGAMPPIDVSVDRSVVGPGEPVEVDVTIRDAALAASDRPVGTSVSAVIGDGPSRSVIRLWPKGVGRLRGVGRAPGDAGAYRVKVVADGASADVPIVVSHQVARVTPDDGDMVGAWVGTRGGSGVGGDQIGKLSEALARAVKPTTRVETWHPMRSGWWVVPFVVLLGMEWWWRRRQGLA